MQALLFAQLLIAAAIVHGESTPSVAADFVGMKITGVGPPGVAYAPGSASFLKFSGQTYVLSWGVFRSRHVLWLARIDDVDKKQNMPHETITDFAELPPMSYNKGEWITSRCRIKGKDADIGGTIGFVAEFGKYVRPKMSWTAKPNGKLSTKIPSGLECLYVPEDDK